MFLGDNTDGLSDLLSIAFGSSTPTADFTRFIRRPAELVVTDAVTPVLDDSGD